MSIPMVPDRFEEMNRSSDLLLGEIRGQMASLIREFEDHRDQSRESSQAMMSKLDHLEVDVNSLKGIVPSLQTQVYSNKSELDKVKSTLEIIKAIYSKAMGAVTLVATIIGMALTGLGYLITHWSEAYTLIRGLFGGK